MAGMILLIYTMVSYLVCCCPSFSQARLNVSDQRILSVLATGILRTLWCCHGLPLVNMAAQEPWPLAYTRIQKHFTVQIYLHTSLVWWRWSCHPESTEIVTLAQRVPQSADIQVESIWVGDKLITSEIRLPPWCQWHWYFKALKKTRFRTKSSGELL